MTSRDLNLRYVQPNIFCLFHAYDVVLDLTRRPSPPKAYPSIVQKAVTVELAEVMGGYVSSLIIL